MNNGSKPYVEGDQHGFKRYRGKPKRRADLLCADAHRLIELIDLISEEGGAVRIGRSRDGGVIAVGIYGASEVPFTTYLHDGNEVILLLEEVYGEITHPHDA